MTQSARWFMDVAEKIFGGMGARTTPIFEQFQQEIGGLEGRDGFLAQVASAFAPEAITPQHFITGSPYGNPEAIVQELEGAAERGWLKAAGEGQYKLTARGKEVAERIFAFVGETFGGIDVLPDPDMERINQLLNKVVEKAKTLPEPADKEALLRGSKFDRGPSAPWTIQVRRRMLDLLGFRDDVHVAAWQSYGVGGQAWEALTFVWRGDAGTAAELAEKLPYRSYDADSYAAALQDLAGRGWIAEADGRYVATEKGKTLRQEAEDTTDRLYDAAWTALSEAETEEAKGLLERLAEAVKPPEEAE
jgi:hypothetical protein